MKTRQASLFQLARILLRLPVSLHQDLKRAAEEEGISLNQYCLYLLARNIKLPQKSNNQHGEDLLRFLNEAHLFQKRLNPKSFLKEEEPPQETPLRRWKVLHAKNRSPFH